MGILKKVFTVLAGLTVVCTAGAILYRMFKNNAFESKYMEQYFDDDADTMECGDDDFGAVAQEAVESEEDIADIREQI